MSGCTTACLKSAGTSPSRLFLGRVSPIAPLVPLSRQEARESVGLMWEIIFFKLREATDSKRLNEALCGIGMLA